VLLAAVAGFTLGTRHYENFFPLQEKTTWEYAVSRSRPGGTPEEGRLTVTNLALTRINQRPVTPRRYEIAVGPARQRYTVFFHNDREGMLFYALQTEKDPQPRVAEPPFYYLRNPLTPGAVWGGEDGPTGRVESVRETVGVPAGTFRDCVVVTLTFPPGKPLKEGRIWYAERVGIVQSRFQYHDGLTETFRLVAVREEKGGGEQP
jgi:hypothetical protein